MAGEEPASSPALRADQFLLANLVERFFGELTQRQLKRLAVTSVDQLVAAITAYIENRNRDPQPFVWTATVQHILDKVGKAKQTLNALH